MVNCMGRYRIRIRITRALPPLSPQVPPSPGRFFAYLPHSVIRLHLSRSFPKALQDNTQYPMSLRAQYTSQPSDQHGNPAKSVVMPRTYPWKYRSKPQKYLSNVRKLEDGSRGEISVYGICFVLSSLTRAFAEAVDIPMSPNDVTNELTA